MRAGLALSLASNFIPALKLLAEVEVESLFEPETLLAADDTNDEAYSNNIEFQVLCLCQR